MLPEEVADQPEQVVGLGFGKTWRVFNQLNVRSNETIKISFAVGLSEAQHVTEDAICIFCNSPGRKKLQFWRSWDQADGCNSEEFTVQAMFRLHKECHAMEGEPQQRQGPMYYDATRTQ